MRLCFLQPILGLFNLPCQLRVSDKLLNLYVSSTNEVVTPQKFETPRRVGPRLCIRIRRIPHADAMAEPSVDLRFNFDSFATISSGNNRDDLRSRRFHIQIVTVAHVWAILSMSRLV